MVRRESGGAEGGVGEGSAFDSVGVARRSGREDGVWAWSDSREVGEN